MHTNISIIIASYNAEATIERALKSVERQVYQDWECIIIDGASKDSTLSIVEKFVNRDSRFKVYSEPDNGVYDAFNKGWKHAQGEWIYYLGSDDELLPNGINALMSKCNGTDFVYGGIITRYKNGKTKKNKPGVFEKAMPFSLATSHQSMIIKRSIIEKVGGFNLNYRILGDYDLINHAYYLGLRTQRVDECIAIFQIGGLSTDNLSSLWERYRILTSYKVNSFRALVHCLYMACFFILCKFKHRFIDS